MIRIGMAMALILLGIFPAFPASYAVKLDIMGPLAMRHAQHSMEIESHSLGAGINIQYRVLGYLVLEPFWYTDYGRYFLKRFGQFDPAESEYNHKWDDEQRFGINLGVHL